MKRLAAILVILAVVAAIAFFVLTIPQRLPADQLAIMDSGDPERGETMIWAGGCTSCHAAEKAEGDEVLKLGGGLALETPFGTFRAPNISTDDENGLGNWSGADFANAMMRGIAPDGSHYYPAFPYTSYARMEPQDVADLWAFMQTLPAVDQANQPHDLPLPFRLRRGLGLWKALFIDDAPIMAVDESDEKLQRGRYLVEGPSHCGECHTPRNLIGGMDASRWLAGGPAPEGDGKIPNITPHADGIGDWTESDIAYSLESGFTPEFDSFGSSMVDVQKNMARLPAEDREAIAAYLKAVPPTASQN